MGKIHLAKIIEASNKFCLSYLWPYLSRSTREPSSSDWVGCWQEEPGARGSSSSSRVWTPTRRSTWGPTTTRFLHKRWRILSNFFIGFIFCWSQFFSMVIKLRLWSYFQFSKHFFIFHKIKSSIIILHLVQPRFSSHKNKIFALNFSLFWVTVLIKGRYKV